VSVFGYMIFFLNRLWN